MEIEHYIGYEVLEQQIETYKSLFDVVRLIDPSNNSVIKYKEDQSILDNTLCHSLWENNRECKNCISKKALKENRMLIKLQHNAEQMYIIVANPIKLEDHVHVLELIKEVTDSIFFESVDLMSGFAVNNINELNTILVKDALTELYNRRYINQVLPIEIAKSVDKRYPVTIVMIDVDCFKKVNDTYGHRIGDMVINRFAKVIDKSIRDDRDWAARYGGDEFLLFLHNADEKKAFKILERMRKAIEKLIIRIEGNKIQVTGSFGFYSLNGNKLSAAEVIKLADVKLYEAKNQGRNKVVF